MKTLGKLAVVLSLAALASGLARADDAKIDKSKLVGSWKVVKADEAPVGAMIEFAKDGKLKIAFEVEGQKTTIDGSYKIEGDKLTITIKFGENESTDTTTVKSVSDSKLTIVDKNSKTTELEKVKKS